MQLHKNIKERLLMIQAVQNANFTITMIDDDETGLFIFEKVASKIPGVTVGLFQFGETVIDLIKAKKFRSDLILLDINMPVMSGWDFLDAFEKLHVNVPVYMVSSSTNPRDLARSKGYQSVKGFYCKPLSHADLRNIVESSRTNA